MTPEELATKHPRLYHLTSPEALDGIRRHGLLSTRQQDWLQMLNSRVFFWPDMRGLGDLAQAKLNRNRERIILVLDTLGLVRRHFARVELTAINTGSTLRRPAPRGLATFVPIARHSYSEFKNLRRKNGRLREVVVGGGVPDITEFLIDVVAPPVA